MAEVLGGAGWHVVAVARTVGGLEALDDRLRDLGGTATLAPMDITNADAMRQLCLSVFQRWGRADLWIHSAIHAAPLAPAGHIDGKDWDRSIDTNVRATGHLIQMVEPLLRAATAGRALFFDDPRAGEPFFGAYGATKAAQIALARSWQAECERIGPSITIAEPAPMPTATRGRFHPGEDRGALAPTGQEARRILGEAALLD